MELGADRDCFPAGAGGWEVGEGEAWEVGGDVELGLESREMADSISHMGSLLLSFWGTLGILTTQSQEGLVLPCYKTGESGLAASFYSDGNVLELGSSDVAQQWERTKRHL